MPLFEYQCQCGNRFEELLKKIEPVTRCPVCNAEAKNIPSVSNFSFGWRLTENSHNRFARDEYERNV